MHLLRTAQLWPEPGDVWLDLQRGCRWRDRKYYVLTSPLSGQFSYRLQPISSPPRIAPDNLGLWIELSRTTLGFCEMTVFVKVEDAERVIEREAELKVKLRDASGY